MIDPCRQAYLQESHGHLSTLCISHVLYLSVDTVMQRNLLDETCESALLLLHAAEACGAGQRGSTLGVDAR